MIAISAILLTLSASALRNYWFAQALEGSKDEVVSQLRQIQQRTDAENARLVYGARFQVGTSNWAVIRYDLGNLPGTSDDVCDALTSYRFDNGVTITAAAFEAPSGVLLSKCPGSSQAFAMFFARGTATAGSVTLRHPITDKTRTVTVLPLTGRVWGS